MGRPRILIVEQDDELRLALQGAVASLGAEALTARGALEALQLLADGEEPPEAVLLDMDLPRQEAQAFLARLRADPHLGAVPVITVSEGRPAGRERSARRPAEACDARDVARILVSLCDRQPGSLAAAKPA